MTRIRQAYVLAALLLGLSACSSVDQQKFEKAYRAGRSTEVASQSGTLPGAKSGLQELGTELAILKGRASNESEERLLADLAGARDAFEWAVVIRELEIEAKGAGRDEKGQQWLPIAGPGMEGAVKRFSLPTQVRGDLPWVESSSARQMLLKTGSEHLEHAAAALR